MKQNIILLISCTLFICLFSGCDKGEDLNQYKIGEFDFKIDSIYNVTQTSVTIKATLYTQKVEKNITGLYVEYYKEEDKGKDNTSKSQSFDQNNGTVVMTITGLEPNTFYCIEPWIAIAHGTNPYVGYTTGMAKPNTEVSFMTHGELPKTGTVNDIDGNVYHYVTIGTQTWLVENLKTTHLRDGTPIPNEKDSAKWCLSDTEQWLQTSLSYCDYNNDTVLGKKYGHIYDIKASLSKIAPRGWHVPTLNEWNVLKDYLISHGYNYDKSTTYNHIAKSLASNSSDWIGYSYNEGSIIDNLSLNNSTGFTALPGGYRSRYGEFKGLGYDCYLWSSTSYYQYNNYIYLNSGSNSLNNNYYDVSGLYIRCIRDNY
jgi:Fibrobacter succinogenes major domain (Fib_succ_major).